MFRKTLATACAACAILFTLGGPAAAQPAHEGPDAGPPTASPADIRFQRAELRTGSARSVGLLPELVDRMPTTAAAYLQPTPDHPNFPTYAGAVVLAAKDGVVVQRAAVGKAVRYSAVGPPPGRVGVELPAEQQLPMRTDTIFDLASISKLFTTIVLMQQVERGTVRLDAPVADYVPEFAVNGKDAVTVRMLLTHRSGLAAFAPLWSQQPTPEARRAAALAMPLMPGATPGGQYVYSDLGLIALGVLVERVTGTPLDEAVRAGITGPLSMVDTRYNPDPSLRDRIAATEFQPYAGRGMVWGEVHDENAWALGGVAGHAGMFSTADDLAILCQMLLNGGQYKGHRILRADTVRQMLVDASGDGRGLGFEINKHSYMGALSSPVTFGHTGFTGTSIVVDPLAHTFVILLSNRVHPDRGWGTNTVARQAMTRLFGDAQPVRSPLGGAAWRVDRRDSATLTLTAPLRRPATREAIASFLFWYDTEPRFDTARFEVSTDGGTSFAPAELTLRAPGQRWTAAGVVTGYGGRHWWHVTATLPAGTTHLRWVATTDGSAQGRGVYVDGMLVVGRDGILLTGADPVTADGWSQSVV